LDLYLEISTKESGPAPFNIFDKEILENIFEKLDLLGD
jgi:hypothetical protein